MEVHPQGNPQSSQLLDMDELHRLFKSLATALLNYYEFPAPPLNEFQLHVYGEFLDHVSNKPTKSIEPQLWLTLISHTLT